jgi:hypothetical protein
MMEGGIRLSHRSEPGPQPFRSYNAEGLFCRVMEIARLKFLFRMGDTRSSLRFIELRSDSISRYLAKEHYTKVRYSREIVVFLSCSSNQA